MCQMFHDLNLPVVQTGHGNPPEPAQAARPGNPDQTHEATPEMDE